MREYSHKVQGDYVWGVSTFAVSRRETEGGLHFIPTFSRPTNREISSRGECTVVVGAR